MEAWHKALSRYIRIVLTSAAILLIVNLLAFAFLASPYQKDGSPWQVADQVAQEIKADQGRYQISPNGARRLKEEGAWAFFLAKDSPKILWQSENTPINLGQQVTTADIASFNSGYLADYPTFTGTSDQGLLVVAYPKQSYWKLQHPSWPYQFIAQAPKFIFLVLAIDFALLLAIYFFTNRRLLRALGPLAEAIQALPNKQRLDLKLAGPFAPIAQKINQASSLLQSQRAELKKKDQARSQWISSISHDIRTPLSMVMGYADQVLNSPHLGPSDQKKIKAIFIQGQKIKDLVEDLNLSSRLDYQMQPLKLEEVNLLALCRQVVADFLNSLDEDRYTIDFSYQGSGKPSLLVADKNLIQRALTNLISNAIRHNPQGCRIQVAFQDLNDEITISVSDNGQGLSPAEIQSLQDDLTQANKDQEAFQGQHGLGLRIVRQIMDNHHGDFQVQALSPQGFQARISFSRSQ
ncbi:HAMP domain-containing sensor histidine kinase [Aerococcus sp. UMB7834]|uniref:sensor histidine kinase n=1 Tax=Aerococcus sp. UMB7834 TaxID=3046342 RepID=UPI00254FA601|nr:HAMP domain-containing sensor histidine kinase [Aerococcus sp. UMB7834]MDK6805436.1 HAMP domain-containing sensor histidine kinase [Aerococcus sp. UMB7834]